MKQRPPLTQNQKISTTGFRKINEKQNLTCHRAQVIYYSKADLILVISEGQIIEKGTHNELIIKTELIQINQTTVFLLNFN